MKLTIGRIIDGVPYGRIGMAIKYLDLEPKIDSMMRDFLNSSRWEKLSKEMSSEILPSGDGSRGSNGFGSQRHHIVPIGEFNGVSITLVAWLGIIS
ncbi:hypothetical protein Tco_0224825 [Tanacetum coccineum]